MNKDTVGIGVPSSLADADMTIFIQGVSYHLFGEYYPIPREAEGMRCYRLARGPDGYVDHDSKPMGTMNEQG